jgi:hypothetical protein
MSRLLGGCLPPAASKQRRGERGKCGWLMARRSGCTRRGRRAHSARRERAHKVQQTTAATPSGGGDDREQRSVLLAIELQGRGVGQAFED